MCNKDTNFMNLIYKDIGKGNPILILHGLYGCSDNWLSIAKVLSKSNRVIIPDLRNHGKSFHSKEFSYKDQVEDILKLLEYLKITNTSIIGHSMGGKIAMALSCEHPQLIDKLIVIDIAPINYSNKLSLEQITFHKKVKECFKNINLNKINSYTELYTQLDCYEVKIKNLIGKNIKRNKDNSFEWKLNIRAIEDNFQEIIGNNLNENNIFSKPCTFISGELSDYITDDVINNVNNYFPYATFITIPKASHWIHSDQPDLLIEAIAQVISKV